MCCKLLKEVSLRIRWLVENKNSRSKANQIGNLQKSDSTHWSSHYESVKRLIEMYAATYKVLEYLTVNSPNGRSRAEVHGVLETITSFEFVFSLHLMYKILELSDVLFQVIQKRSQDILAAFRLSLPQKLSFKNYENSFIKLDVLLTKLHLSIITTSMSSMK
ncbi:General transcription factor 2-related zinc finger protein [Abeliophyllum distichum]|uniref:General transcription factor 2-related zinc finger protein n=1 Tax=Abeliophyllum distichum TaxID=126358 RepID=A0ABD1S8F7_9LAMI